MATERFAGPSGRLVSRDPDLAGGLAEWVEILARMSHDLRTPLNAVIGFSDAMQNELFGPLGHARYQEYARHIRRSGDLLLRAAEDTLAMTSLLVAPRAEVATDVELSPLLLEVAASHCAAAQAGGATIEVDADAAIAVRADARVLRQAVAQLIACALARASCGSRVRLSAIDRHGGVELTVTCAGAAGDGAAAWPAVVGGPERGLGREQLALRMARMLLDLLSSPLHVISTADALTLRTELEAARQQADFFALSA